MSRRLADAIAESASDCAEAAANAVVTISARLPILAQHAVLPSADGLSEWHRAWSEKIDAAWDGTVAAVETWNRLAYDAIWAPLTPVGYAQNAVALMRAVATPAHSCVRANALRLGGRP